MVTMATMHLGRRRSYGTAEDLGLDPDGGKWVVICERHATVVNVETLAQARSTRTEEFCETCRGDDDFPYLMKEES